MQRRLLSMLRRLLIAILATCLLYQGAEGKLFEGEWPLPAIQLTSWHFFSRVVA